MKKRTQLTGKQMAFDHFRNQPGAESLPDTELIKLFDSYWEECDKDFWNEYGSMFFYDAS